MSTAVFPALIGLGWTVKRSPEWLTKVATAVSGKETRLDLWTYPRHHWALTYDLLRSDDLHAEWQSLMGFFNARRGQYDSFLYEDPDDRQVSAQRIGEGDGATTTFQLYRGLGGFVEPVLAPKSVTAVSVDGVAQDGWSVSGWGGDTPGVLTLAAAPAAGAAITADFSYYFPCRFEIDQLDLEKFAATLWQGRSVTFVSLK